MKTKGEILELLKFFMKERGEFFTIEKLGLFGSVVRDDNDESSDIDVCITFYGPVGFGKLYRIKEELESLLKWEVDLVPLHKNMPISFANELKKEAIYV